MRLHVGIAVLSAALPLSAATFTVTNTFDSGPGSLRQAIKDANANPGADTIVFAIPDIDPNCDAAGVCTIRPLTDLPMITETVTIDGYTQPGAAMNTDPQNSNAVLKIVLLGDLDTDPTHAGFFIVASGSVVRGLAIGLFDDALLVEASSGVEITGCFLGTDASGLAAEGNSRGVSAIGANNLVVGGTDPADRNVISANIDEGLDIEDCDGAQVQGNLVGTNAQGTGALGNGTGIYASGSFPMTLTVGGPATGARNVFSGNVGTGAALLLASGSTVLVQGNVFGTGPDGSLPLGNRFAGIQVSVGGAWIGGINPGEGNVIAYNGAAGVAVDNGASGVTIRWNSIFQNHGLGIDLGSDGPTPNDAGDGDTGANGLQNYPVISSWTVVPGGIRIQGVLHSKPSSGYDIDFYTFDECPPTPGQGHHSIGTTQVTTDANGTASFDVTVNYSPGPGERVSGTATDSQGSTSEFSRSPVAFVTPNSGDAAGGSTISVWGSDFQAGLALDFGGVPAADVQVNNFNSLTATMPPLNPGQLYDVTVTAPDGTAGTLAGAYVTNFLDVPASHPFYQYVTNLVLQRVTVGIGGGLYGVTQEVTRRQMAVFILKAMFGQCYVPPPATGKMFGDVPAGSPAADWIEAFGLTGITAGCQMSPPLYCPDAFVPRKQMAVFMEKAKQGVDYTPPGCVGIFNDVSCASPFARWVEKFFNDGYTGGCQANPPLYCPDTNVTRGQMAVFETKVFY